MRVSAAYIPAAPYKVKLEFYKNKRKFDKQVDKWELQQNAKVANGPRRERLENTYGITLKNLIEILAWQFVDGLMRTDGYFYTSNGGLRSYKRKTLSKRTIQRHIKLLQDRGIIKDIDKKTARPPGTNYRHGFWVRLDDWILKGLIDDVALTLYEVKKEVLQEEKNKAADTEQKELAQQPAVKEKMQEAIERTSEKLLKQVEERGHQYKFDSLLGSYIAKNAKIKPQSPPDSS